MTERLALFPLNGVLYPGMLLPLHIFERRYRLLIQRAVERGEPFGVVLIKSGDEVGGPAEPHTIGTAASIVGVTPLEDGQSYIVARGERRFVIEGLSTEDEPYLVGTVRWLDEPEGDDAANAARVASDAYGTYLVAAGAVLAESGGIAPDAPAPDMAPTELAYRIATNLAVPNADRQTLLELPSAGDRLREELHLLARETELLRGLLVRIRAEGGRRDLN